MQNVFSTYSCALIIMSKIKLLPIVFGLASLLVTLPTCAQETEKAKASAPQLETLQNSEPPTITIRQPSTEGANITEKRVHGVVKEIKVKTKGSTYYLKPRGAAATPPAAAHESEISVPQWVIKEFDVGQNSGAATDKSKTAPTPPAKQAK